MFFRNIGARLRNGWVYAWTAGSMSAATLGVGSIIYNLTQCDKFGCNPVANGTRNMPECWIALGIGDRNAVLEAKIIGDTTAYTNSYFDSHYCGYFQYYPHVIAFGAGFVAGFVIGVCKTPQNRPAEQQPQAAAPVDVEGQAGQAEALQAPLLNQPQQSVWAGLFHPSARGGNLIVQGGVHLYISGPP
jgi:hypothetical protein